MKNLYSADQWPKLLKPPFMFWHRHARSFLFSFNSTENRHLQISYRDIVLRYLDVRLAAYGATKFAERNIFWMRIGAWPLSRPEQVRSI